MGSGRQGVPITYSVGSVTWLNSQSQVSVCVYSDVPRTYLASRLIKIAPYLLHISIACPVKEDARQTLRNRHLQPPRQTFSPRLESPASSCTYRSQLASNLVRRRFAGGSVVSMCPLVDEGRSSLL